jgi:hypothetical protein
MQKLRATEIGSGAAVVPHYPVGGAGRGEGRAAPVRPEEYVRTSFGRGPHGGARVGIRVERFQVDAGPRCGQLCRLLGPQRQGRRALPPEAGKLTRKRGHERRAQPEHEAVS